MGLAVVEVGRGDAERRNTVTPEGPKPGGSWFHVRPEAATKMIAARTSRSP